MLVSGQIASDAAKYRRTAIALLAAYLVALAVLPLLFGLRVDYNWILRLYILAGIPALTLPWILWRKLDAVQPLVEATVVTMMLMPPQLTLTFVMMRFKLPLVTGLLVRMDQAIGFDWAGFVRMVDDSAGLSWLLGAAYNSIFLQVVLAPGILCLLQRQARAFRLIICYELLGLFASLIASFLPSMSAYAGYNIDVRSLHHIDARNSWSFDSALNAVRNDPNFVLNARSASGIVNFPSVHAGLALLLIWTAWPTKLRYPIAALNCLMIIGAITHGAHYLVDVIGGLALAAGVVVVSSVASKFALFSAQAGSSRHSPPASAAGERS